MIPAIEIKVAALPVRARVVFVGVYCGLDSLAAITNVAVHFRVVDSHDEVKQFDSLKNGVRDLHPAAAQ